MKVKYTGKDYLETAFDEDKEYDVSSIEKGWYRIMTELDKDYLFPPELFEITDDSGYDELKIRDENREWKNPKSSERYAV